MDVAVLCRTDTARWLILSFDEESMISTLKTAKQATAEWSSIKWPNYFIFYAPTPGANCSELLRTRPSTCPVGNCCVTIVCGSALVWFLIYAARHCRNNQNSFRPQTSVLSFRLHITVFSLFLQLYPRSLTRAVYSRILQTWPNASPSLTYRSRIRSLPHQLFQVSCTEANTD